VATVGKEAERAELHKTIWRIANDLRGSVDGWDFKTYVLGTFFYRFISENLTAYVNSGERKAGNPDFDYTTLSDEQAEYGRRATVEEKGFYILEGRQYRCRSSCGGSVVLVDEATELVAAANLTDCAASPHH